MPIRTITVSLLIMLCLLLSVSTSTKAQDIHYTQYYTDFLRLNPAMTGNFNGNYRVGLNLRNQWRNPANYQTASLFGDFAFLKNRSETTWVGSGLRLLYDRAGVGDLNILEANVTLAVHQSFSDYLYGSFGIGAMMVQKQVDISQFFFSDQWNGTNFGGSTNEDNMQNWQPGQQTWDLQAGGVLNYHVEDIASFHLGTSLLHINRPKDTFSETGDFKKGLRSNTHINASIVMGSVFLEPGAYFSIERKASEFMLGSNVVIPFGGGGYYDDESIKLYVGGWYRFKSSIAGLLGMEWKRYRLLFSYDLHQNFPNRFGNEGPEISLMKVGGFASRKRSKLYCPRF